MTVRLAAAVIALLAALGLVERAPGAPGDRMSLVSLADWDRVTVSLDLSRFAAERVGLIRIVNPSRHPIQGSVPACTTVFIPTDPALPRLRPAESGDFVVGPGQTATLARLFRVVDQGKRAPATGSAYTLIDQLEILPGCTD